MVPSSGVAANLARRGRPLAGNTLVFYVNGRRVAIEHPDPTTLLVDWLRSDAIGLTGTKLSCGEGGCGACTVMLSRWDGERARVEDTAVNACLRPLVSLDGAMITTTEGIGSTRETLDPVQFRIAAYNGSTCSPASRRSCAPTSSTTPGTA